MLKNSIFALSKGGTDGGRAGLDILSQVARKSWLHVPYDEGEGERGEEEDEVVSEGRRVGEMEWEKEQRDRRAEEEAEGKDDRIRALQEEVGRMRREPDRMRENEKLEKALEKVKEEAEEKDDRIRALEEEVGRMRREADRMTRENEKLKKVLEKAKDKWDRLKEGARTRKAGTSGGKGGAGLGSVEEGE